MFLELRYSLCDVDWPFHRLRRPSRPHPSATACQVGPGMGVTAPPPTFVFPSISQIEVWAVLVFCHRMSEPPAPVPNRLPTRPGTGMTGPPPIRVFSSISQIEVWAVLVFCHRMSEKPLPRNRPFRPHAKSARDCCHHAAADPGVIVHLPNGGLAGARVLPQDVGEAVVVEIAGSDRFRFRPGVEATAPPPVRVFPLISQIEDLAGARVLPRISER